MNHTWKVGEGEEDRVDRFVSSRSDRSRSVIQKDIARGYIQINGTAAATAKHAVQARDVITYIVPEAETGFPQGEATSLEVLYEDEWLLAINKPVDMVVHPNSLEESGTLVQALIHRYPSIVDAVYDPTVEVSRLRPGIAHRLDKDTSGVIVVAKDKDTLQKLAALFQNHAVHKQYLALVHGTITAEERVETLIARKGFKRNMMGISIDEERGRNAITHFRPLTTYTFHTEQATMLSCEIETGRTHQIRVHCKYKGHPVLGDAVYTNKPAKALSERLGIQRQLLHAWKLSFIHPCTGKTLELVAPIAEDFRTILTKLIPADSLELRGSNQLFL